LPYKNKPPRTMQIWGIHSLRYCPHPLENTDHNAVLLVPILSGLSMVW